MAEPPKSRRRDFLTGRAAADAVYHALSGPPELHPTGAAPVEAHLLHFTRTAMACQFELIISPDRYRHAADAALEALDLIDELEEQLSVYRPASEVSRLNALAATERVPVEAGLFGLIERSLDLHRETGGAFDITAGPLSRCWGFFRREGKIPSEDELHAALAQVGSGQLELNPEARSVRFLSAGMEINFGAIGKGYALDRAGQRLTGAGIEDFVFHGGRSSMLARGSMTGGRADDDGWTVGIGHPLRPGKRLAELHLSGHRGLSTSGSGTQFFRHAGERYGHILDPRTGQPAAGMLSVTVTAPTAAEADALSTAFYVLGVEESLQYCQRHPEIAALLVAQTPQGTARIETAGFAAGDLTMVES